MTGGGYPRRLPVVVPGSVLLRGSAADPAKAIFIGIGPQADVAAYLAGVSHSEIVDVRFSPSGPCTAMWPAPEVRRCLRTRDSGPRWPPAQGTQELSGICGRAWAVVIMNADASAPVAVDLQAGARSDLLWPVFIGLLVGGILLLLIGVPLIVLGAAGLGRGRPGRRPDPASGATLGRASPSRAAVPAGPIPPGLPLAG